MIPNLRLYLELAAAVLLLTAFGWYTVHERGVGQANLQHSIDAATLKAQADAARQTRVLQAKADAANQEAIHAQDQLAAYLAAHPVGPVRLCVQSPAGRPSVPQPSSGASAPADPTPAAGGVPSVPGVVAGPDISGGLALIVRAAAELSVSDRQFQVQTGAAP